MPGKSCNAPYSQASKASETKAVSFRPSLTAASLTVGIVALARTRKRGSGEKGALGPTTSSLPEGQATQAEVLASCNQLASTLAALAPMCAEVGREEDTLATLERLQEAVACHVKSVRSKKA